MTSNKNVVLQRIATEGHCSGIECPKCPMYTEIRGTTKSRCLVKQIDCKSELSYYLVSAIARALLNPEKYPEVTEKLLNILL